jgi:hypothetical protein
VAIIEKKSGKLYSTIHAIKHRRSFKYMDFFIFLGLLIIAVILLLYGLRGKVKFTGVKKDLITGHYFEVDEKGNRIHPEYIKPKTTIKNKENSFFLSQTSARGFWNGHKGLALTFWGFFVGGNILFNTATIIFVDNPTLIMVNLILFILWNVLAVMGVFNAADIYKAEKIKQGLPYTPATVAKVAVVLLILSGIGNSIPK